MTKTDISLPDATVPVDADVDTDQAAQKLEYDLPVDLDRFDEFGRDLNPPP